jgi:ubiquinone/menaquinone biosynthesis C-methylase UbiE
MLTTFYPMLQPVYPLLAQQFVDDYGLETGVAVDVGAGPGHLGLNLASITNMDIVFLDISEKALNRCHNNAQSLKLDNKLSYVRTDVASIPLQDQAADFVMSRGSLWFWKEPKAGLTEVARILKPGSVAFIGGGLGRYVPKTMRLRLMKANRKARRARGETRPTFEEFKPWIEELLGPVRGISYKIMSDNPQHDSGKWVEIRKGADRNVTHGP